MGDAARQKLQAQWPLAYLAKMLEHIDSDVRAIPETAAKTVIEHRWASTLEDLAAAAQEVLMAEKQAQLLDGPRIHGHWENVIARLFHIGALVRNLRGEVSLH